MIVVTGASGFIGSNLVKVLKQLNEDVLCVDYVKRNYTDDDIINPDEFLNNINEYGDIELIFHEGAISSTTEMDWKKLYNRNVRYTCDLMKYCFKRNIPFQYASSASVYGNPSLEEWNNPDKEYSPLNRYAMSKVLCDDMASTLIKENKKSLIQGMRYFNVYGLNEDHKKGQSSPHHAFRTQLEETGKIKLFEGSKEFVRDFVSVNQVITQKIFHLNTSPSGFYDVGTGKPKSFYDVAIEIGASDDDIEWVPMPDNLKEHYQKYSIAVKNCLTK